MATINSLGMPNPITVPFGATGLASMPTPYGVLCSGTTGTNQLQNVATLGTATQVLTSNGPGVLPTWQNQGPGVVPSYTPPTAWTPVLNFNQDPTGITYSTQTGLYMTIGQLTYFTFILTLSSKGSNSGQMGISGLPSGSTFPWSPNQGLSSGCIFNGSSLSPYSFIGFNNDYFQPVGVPRSFWLLYGQNSTGSGVGQIIHDTQITNTTTFIGSGYIYDLTK